MRTHSIGKLAYEARFAECPISL